MLYIFFYKFRINIYRNNRKVNNSKQQYLKLGLEITFLNYNMLLSLKGIVIGLLEPTVKPCGFNC